MSQSISIVLLSLQELKFCSSSHTYSEKKKITKPKIHQKVIIFYLSTFQLEDHNPQKFGHKVKKQVHP